MKKKGKQAKANVISFTLGLGYIFVSSHQAVIQTSNLLAYFLVQSRAVAS